MEDRLPERPPRLGYEPGPTTMHWPWKAASLHSSHSPALTTIERARSLKPPSCRLVTSPPKLRLEPPKSRPVKPCTLPPPPQRRPIGSDAAGRADGRRRARAAPRRI